ncbi:MAG: c-type cytochrome biogenesis protein CcmI/CycH [Nitrospinales bacterium]
MKYLILFSLGLCLFWTTGCEKELKEHPIPPDLKAKLDKQEKQNDPAMIEKQISGKITLNSSAGVTFPPNSVLFIFARSTDGRRGPPLAAKRIPTFEFPMEYTIGPADAMMEGVEFGEEVKIIARIDADGIAGASEGDIEGEVVAKPGDKNIDILLVAGPAVAQNDETVKGTITVAEGLKDKLPVKAALFIIARKEGDTGRAPLAVQRFEKFEFPLEYSIGQADVMMPGSVFEGNVVIIARLDGDGNATSSNGDVEGAKAAKPGDEKIDIQMDKLIGG